MSVPLRRALPASCSPLSQSCRQPSGRHCPPHTSTTTMWGCQGPQGRAGPARKQARWPHMVNVTHNSSRAPPSCPASRNPHHCRPAAEAPHTAKAPYSPSAERGSSHEGAGTSTPYSPHPAALLPAHKGRRRREQATGHSPDAMSAALRILPQQYRHRLSILLADSHTAPENTPRHPRHAAAAPSAAPELEQR